LDVPSADADFLYRDWKTSFSALSVLAGPTLVRSEHLRSISVVQA
jgi:hypothetical protein